MKGYLAYSGTLSSYSTTSTEASALSRARTRSMLTLIPRPVPGPFGIALGKEQCVISNVETIAKELIL